MDTLAGYGLPYWLDLPRPRFPRLEEDSTADAVVIGGGICGLKMAHYLQEHGLKTVILEGSQVGDGASSRNQGSVNHGGGASYAECIKRYGRAQARAVWTLGLENQRLIQAQLAQYAIDCDYEVGGYTFLARRDMPNWEATLADYQHEVALLTEDGFAVEFLDEQAALQVSGNPLFAGGYTYLTDAQFHSGNYVVGLAQGVARLSTVTVYEGSRVQRIVRRSVK